MTNTDKQPEPSEEFKRDVESAIVNELVRKIVEVEFAKPEVMARLNAAVMDVVNKPPTGGVVRPAVQGEQRATVSVDVNAIPSPAEFAGTLKANKDVLRAKVADQTFGARCIGCSEKDRELAQRSLELDKWRKEHSRREQECEALKRSIATQIEALQAEHKDRETLAVALQSERAAHGVTRESFDATLRNEERLVRECNALRKFEAQLSTEFTRTKEALSRESAEHYATRVRLRDALRDAAKLAREVGDYAKRSGDDDDAAISRRMATKFDAARAALGLDTIDMPPAAGETATQQPAPAPARRRRFLAGDLVAFPHSTDDKFRLPLDEQDDGIIVGFDTGRASLDRGVRAEWLHMIKPTTPAKRNSELAFHFHRWNIDSASGAMDTVPEFARRAAEQLLRDPFGTEYGSVLADVDAKTGGAK